MSSANTKADPREWREWPCLARRGFLTTFCVGGLAGCVTLPVRRSVSEAYVSRSIREGKEFDPSIIYRRTADAGIDIPAVNYRKLPPELLRQRVAAPAGASPSTILVRLSECHLYLICDDGTAIRYGIAVGREGFAWSGAGTIGRKETWPAWTPPPEMIVRMPELAAYRDGMPGGPANPLGARALYIYQSGQDTLYRIHGTPEWWTIGHATSSGCLRMLNQDVVDLYSRVAIANPVRVAF